MSAPYLNQLPNGHWHYRRIVPEALRPIFGKREIKKSLGTDLKSAMKEYAEVHAAAEKALANAKLATPPDSIRAQVLEVLSHLKMTPEDLSQIVGADPDDPESLDAATGFDAILDELADAVEKAARHRKEAHISADAIRALSAGAVPREMHTIASALEFYRKGHEGQDAAKNNTLGNRISNLKDRMASALSNHAITSLTR